MEAKREEFRKYLEKEGVLEFLTKQLVKLYEETDKPENALDYLKSNVVGSQPPANESRIEELEKENSSLKDRVKVLEEQNQTLLQQLEDKVKSEQAKVEMQEDATAVEKDTEVAMDTESADVEEEKPKNTSEPEPKDIENTVSDSEETKVKDEKQKERISAMNSLESYCSNMKSTVEDEKFKDKISDSDKETITKKCDETIKWMETNQLAEVDEFQDQQKAVEGVCNPIITKLNQQADGAEGMSGDMPEEMPGSNESAGESGGPAVEAD